MEHIIDALDGRGAGVAIADVAFDHPESVTVGGGHEPLELVEVALVPGREIVEPDDPLPRPQQRLDQVRSDEAGSAGHQPGRSLAREQLVQLFIHRGRFAGK